MGTRRILIVDDSATVRSVIRTFLEREDGCEVCGEAQNGRDAISMARDLRPDLILLDLAMPVMSGLEAAPVLRGILPTAVIFFVSMYSEMISGPLSSLLGNCITVSKTEGIQKLLQCVRAL